MGKTIRPDVKSKIDHRQRWWENGHPDRRACAFNFDGQGISLGRYNFAGMDGPLQQIIRDYVTKYPDAARATLNRDGYTLYEEIIAVLPDRLPLLFNRINIHRVDISPSVHPQSKEFKIRLYNGRRPDGGIIEPWKSGLERAAMTAEWYQCELPWIEQYFRTAENIVNYFNTNSRGDRIDTDRCLDLAFDIACQSGGMKMYPLGETVYMDKLNAIVVAYRSSISASPWVDSAVKRKTAILEGKYPMYGWSGEYDDLPMYVEDYERVVKVEKFQDIKGHYAESSLRKFIERGIIQGKPDGTVGPDEPCTLARTVLLIDRALDDFYKRHMKGEF